MNNSFKQVFISQKNTGYLFDLIISRVLRNNSEYQQIIFSNIHSYKSNLIEIQTYVFDDTFHKFYNSNGNLDFEEILISLNKLTITKFEYLLYQDLNKKYNAEINQNRININQNNNIQKLENTSNDNVLQINQPKIKQDVIKQDVIKQDVIKQDVIKQDVIKQDVINQDVINQDVIKQDVIKQDVIKQDVIKQDVIKQDVIKQDVIKTRNQHYLSKHAIFKNGVYHFDFQLKNVKSINLQSIKINCNLYNINEYNNTFTIIEKNNKILISIPIGYYSIEILLKVITSLLNNCSQGTNEYIYNVYKNTFTNKIHFTREVKNVDNGNNYIFGIDFTPKDRNIQKNYNNYNNYNLYEILGFRKREYFNNNIYISENHPVENVFEEIYIKLCINNKELQRYNTTLDTFSYYESIQLNMDENFGKTLYYNYDFMPYDIIDKLDINSLSLQFYNTFNYHLHNMIEFDFILYYEYA